MEKKAQEDLNCGLPIGSEKGKISRCNREEIVTYEQGEKNEKIAKKQSEEGGGGGGG